MSLNKMNIAIDILHISYWNFYKNIIHSLEEKGHNVYLFVRQRGPLLQVIKKEYFNHEKIILTGRYYKGRKKLLLHLLRIPKLLYFIKKYKIDVVSSDGFFVALAARIFNLPAVMHSDDFEYKFSYKMTQFFSTKMLIPDVFPITSEKDILYKGCKEYAYLSNEYFMPHENALAEIVGNNTKYVFIRLVSKSSLNYLGSYNVLSIINNLIDFLEDKNVKVLVSSEENYNKHRNNCTVLSPPIENFHSILKYAILTITEGDTMARESAILGTPVVYMGGRSMNVHNYFNKNKFFIETQDKKEIIKFIQSNILSNNCNVEFTNDFDNINEIMVHHIIHN